MTEDNRRGAEPAGLAAAGIEFDRGRLPQALAILRALPRTELDAHQVAVAERLHGMAAFRTGEMEEAVAHARQFLGRVDAGVETALEFRFDVLAVAVVAAGELAIYDESLERLRELLGLSTRLGGRAHAVRARGSAASAFALLGDVWASRRILASLALSFAGLEAELRLESTVRNNLASVNILVARMARGGGDDEAAHAALSDAETQIQRSADIARQLGDTRLSCFSRLHRIELGLLRDEPVAADGVLAESIRDAQAAGLWAHWRQLKLLEVEVLLCCGDAAQALAQLEPLGELCGDSHDLSSRIRLQQLRTRALRGLGLLEQALAAHDQLSRLQAFQSYRQAQAQSALMRTRLELEHLFIRSMAAEAP
jgi:hypothetical protein